MINIAALVDNADSLSVATYIGMEVQRGRRIRCPGHMKRLGKEDNHIGNAVLTPKGYHCFACDITVGMIDMVQEFLGCGKLEAMKCIAESMGQSLEEYTDDSINVTGMPDPEYSEEFLKTIGINAGRRICGTETRFDDNGLCSQEHDPDAKFGYLQLYQEDPEALKQIVKHEAEKYKAVYERILETSCSPSAPEAGKVFDLMSQNNRLPKGVWKDLKQETSSRLTQIRLQVI